MLLVSWTSTGAILRRSCCKWPAPVRNLGGRTITVTCAVGYTRSGFGFIRGGIQPSSPLDLAPPEPWNLVRRKGKLLVLYGPREEWDFHFENCRVGNCNASASELPVLAEGGSTDGGRNRGITFLAPPKAP